MRTPDDQRLALECLRLTGGDIRRATLAFDFVKGKEAAPGKEMPDAAGGSST